MALPRYQGGQVPLGQGPAIGFRAQAATIDSFVQGIQGIKQGAIQTVEQQSIERAKQDAEKAFTERGLKAEVNRDMTVYGQQYANTIESLHKKKIAIDTGKRFTELYQLHRDNPAAFEEVSEAYRQTTIKELPSHLKADFTIDFEANKAHYSGQVSANSIKKIKERDVALTMDLFKDSTEKATQAFRDHNPTLALHEITKAAKAIEDSYENGNIDLNTKNEKLDLLYYHTTRANFKGVNDGYIERNDLEGAQDNINKFRDAKLEGFSDEQRQRLADEMQQDLDAKIRSLGAVAKADEKRIKEESKIAVSDAIKIYKSGKLPDIEGIDIAYQNVDMKLQHEYDVYKKAHEASRPFSTKSLQEQQAIVNSIKAGKSGTRVEKEVLDIMQSNLNEKFNLSKKDPMSLGSIDGLYSTPIESIPELGMSELARILPDRVSNSELNIQHYGRGASMLFTETEAQAWSDWLTSPDTKEKEIKDFLYAVEEGAGAKSGSVYNQLVKKGAGLISMAGSMIKEGKGNVGMNILRGAKVLKTMDPEVISDIKEDLRGKIGNALSHNVDNLEATLNSMLALYADGVSKEGTFDKSSKKSRIDKAFKDLTNGIHKRNGQSFFLPKDKTVDDFDAWVDDLTPNSIDEVYGMTKDEAIKVIQNGRFVSVGSGSYMVYMRNTNSVLKTTDGNTYVLRFDK